MAWLPGVSGCVSTEILGPSLFPFHVQLFRAKLYHYLGRHPLAASRSLPARETASGGACSTIVRLAAAPRASSAASRATAPPPASGRARSARPAAPAPP